VIEYWNKDLWYSCHPTKMEVMEFLQAMLAEMNPNTKSMQEETKADRSKTEGNREATGQRQKEIEKQTKSTCWPG
jgi:hypothetical protein